MLTYIPVIIVSAAFFLALVMNLAAKPKYSARLTEIFMLISISGGLIIYGCGYAQVSGNILLTIVRTVYSVMGMFLGKNDLSAIAGSFFVTGFGWNIVFWVLHMMAFYTTASAAMVTIGAKAIRSLRLLLSRRGNLVLIYGISPDTINLGAECHEKEKASVIFIAADVTDSTVTAINNKGMNVFTGAEAVSSDAGFLKRLHLKNGRLLTVFALDDDVDSNLFYANSLMAGLEALGIDPRQTRITLPGTEDILTDMLQHSTEHYGFGYVQVFDTADLAARLMIKKCPPWDSIAFDQSCHAMEDMDVLIVGFGSFGQAALRHLIMNGQYAGSHFHAMIFSPGYEREAGYLETDCRSIFSEYDIEHTPQDGRSSALFSYVEKHLRSLKYIVVATGNDRMNREVSDHLMLFLQRRHAEQIYVVQLGHSGVRYQQKVGSPILSYKLICLDTLDSQAIDRQAIILNSLYDTSESSAWEKWISCPVFSKMSSRASVDFIPAMLHASHLSADAIMENGLPLSEEQLTVLGETEHRRWCAFHYCMGYVKMPDAVYEANLEEFRICKEQGIPFRKRINKDISSRMHACLIPWDELDAMSEKENGYTGKNIDYKQLDINNVLVIPQVLHKEA